MKTIDRTLIATTDPVTIGGGIHFFEEDPPSDLGFSIGATLWDTSKTFDIPILPTVKLSTRSAITLEGGVIGPNWGGRMEVEGDLTNEDMTLSVSMDEFTAGMVIGIVGRFEFQIDVQRSSHHWVKHGDHWYSRRSYDSYWIDEGNVVVPIEIDLLPALFNIALTIGGMIPALSKIVAFIPKGLLDHMRDTKTGIAGNGGTVKPEPSIIGQIDLVNLLITLGASGVEVVQPELVPAVEAVTKIDKVMKKLKPSITTGPVFGVSFPIEISISGLCAYDDNHDRYLFETPSYTGINKVSAKNIGGIEPDINRVGINFEHKSGTDLVLGWFCAISWLKVFSKEVKYTKDVLSTLGIDVMSSATVYGHEINNEVGKTTDTTIEVNFLYQNDND